MRKFAFVLSLLLIFTIPWEDALTLAGVASLTRYLGIIVAGAWLVSVLFSQKIRKPNIFHLFMILFVVWNVASIFWTIALDESIQQIITYAQLLVLTMLIWDLYTSTKAINQALQAYILGAYVAIVTTIINYALGREIELYSGGRYAGVGNAVELALTLTLGLPIAWYLATLSANQKVNRILRVINFAYIPAALFAIIITGTRMAVFAVVPAFAYILGTSNRLRPAFRVLIFAALIGVFLVVQPYIPKSVIERLGTTTSSIALGDLGGRVELWRQSLAYFFSHPIIGTGTGALSSIYGIGTVAHNTFLSILTELGLIGLILFICVLAVTLQQALTQPKDYAILWVAILAIWSIGVFTLTWEFRKTTWLFLTLIIAGTITSQSPISQENSSVIPSEVNLS